MTNEGVIFMLASWSTIIGLSLFCLARLGRSDGLGRTTAEAPGAPASAATDKTPNDRPDHW